MDPISFRSIAGLALDTLGANILSKSDGLNRLVNSITGGRVNRDLLSKHVWQSVVQLVRNYAESPKALEKSNGALLPLSITALLLGDKKEMIEAVSQLVRTGIDGTLKRDNQGVVKDALISNLSRATAALSGLIARLGEEKSGEKVLATMLSKHGWKPLTKMLEGRINAFPGGAFLFRQIKRVVETAIVADPKINLHAAEPGLYTALAETAHLYLEAKGIDEVLKPLRDFAPLTFTAIDAAVNTYKKVPSMADATRCVVNAKRYVADTVPALLDSVHSAAGLGAEPLVISEAFAKEVNRLQGGATLTLAPEANDSQIAERYLTALSFASSPKVLDSGKARLADEGAVVGDTPALGETASLSDTAMLSETASVSATVNVMQALTSMIEVKPERAGEAFKVLHALAPEQIAPLGERSDIAVVKTVTGRLKEIDTVSHRLLEKNALYTEEVGKRLLPPTRAMADLGGYLVDNDFADDFERLNLIMPDASYGVSDTAVEGARTMWNTGWGMLGYETTSLTHMTNTQLKQLWNVCGKDERVMQEASRYMTFSMAQNALANPLKTHLRLPDSDPARVDVGNGMSVELKDVDLPEFQFNISNDHGLVNLSIEARWPISAFGSPETGMRTPRGDQDSVLISTAIVTIRSGYDDSLEVKHYAMGTSATIENKLAFDTATGRLAEPQSG